MIVIDLKKYKDLNPSFYFALEEWAMENHEFDGNSVVFLWTCEPSVMIGKFQNTYEEVNMEFIRDNNINIIRRNSGGGAIYVDGGTLQFSFVDKRGNADKIRFYEFLEPVKEVIERYGIKTIANTRNDILIDIDTDESSVELESNKYDEDIDVNKNNYELKENKDVDVNKDNYELKENKYEDINKDNVTLIKANKPKKVSGNAQYFKGKTLIHHGSILFDVNVENLISSLNPPKQKYESKGYKSLRERIVNIKDVVGGSLGRDISIDEFSDEIKKDLLKYDKNNRDISYIQVKNKDNSGTQNTLYELREEDIKTILSLEGKFKSWDWKYKENPNFLLSKKITTDGGTIMSKLRVENGVIMDISVRGDFFSAFDIEDIEERFIGIKYDILEIEKNYDKICDDLGAEEIIYKTPKKEFLKIFPA